MPALPGVLVEIGDKQHRQVKTRRAARRLWRIVGGARDSSRLVSAIRRARRAKASSSSREASSRRRRRREMSDSRGGPAGRAANHAAPSGVPASCGGDNLVASRVVFPMSTAK